MNSDFLKELSDVLINMPSPQDPVYGNTYVVFYGPLAHELARRGILELGQCMKFPEKVVVDRKVTGKQQEFHFGAFSGRVCIEHELNKYVVEKVKDAVYRLHAEGFSWEGKYYHVSEVIYYYPEKLMIDGVMYDAEPDWLPI